MSETAQHVGHWVTQVGTVEDTDGRPRQKVQVDQKRVSVGGDSMTPAQIDALCGYLRQAQAVARFRAPLDLGPGGIVDQGWYWRCTACGEHDAAYISEQAAQDALDRHVRTECEERELP